MPLGDKGTFKATTVPATFFQESPCDPVATELR